MPQRLTRQQLHARVWQQPITKLAREFGLSDVALHKICRKYDVPTPPAGYWTKKTFGKPVRVTPLPNPGDARDILIRETTASNEPEALAEARAKVLATLGRAGDVPPPNMIVERTLAKLRGAKPNRDGLVRVEGPSLVKVQVRPDSVERAAALLTALVAAGEQAGLELVKHEAGAAWSFEGQFVAFELVEAADQVEHVATDKELAAVEKWRRDRDETHRRYGYWSDYGEPKIPKWEQRHQGRLMVRLEDVRVKTERYCWGESIQRSFAESRVRQLEPAIPRIIATVAAMAAAKTSNTAFEERERVIAAEQARRWAEAERRRKHEEKAAALLDSLVDEQARVDRLRVFSTALREGSPSGRTRQLLEWTEARLAALEQRLSGSALEERLTTAGLFEPEEDRP